MLTFNDAQTICQKQTSDSSSESLTNFKLMMNIGYQEILATFGRPVTEKIKTLTTVASQQFYTLPVDVHWVKTCTVTVGSTVYPVTEITSQDKWNYLNMTSQSSTYPQYFFLKKIFGLGGDEIGFYPTPSTADYTITLVAEVKERDLSQAAYTTGTVALTNADATVTGSGTTFTAGMVGRYFNITDNDGDGLWYRIKTFTSATSLELDTVYGGTTDALANYTINEAFNLPEEMQILPVYFALFHYYARQEQSSQEQKYEKLYNTGILAAKTRHGTKTRGNIVRSNRWWGFGKGYPSNFPASMS